MLRATLFLMTLAILIAPSAFAEIVRYEFTATVESGGTVRGASFFDTGRVLVAFPISAGTAWAFTLGGLGSNAPGIAPVQNTDLSNEVSCQAGLNGQDFFSLRFQATHLIGPVDPLPPPPEPNHVFSFNVQTTAGDLFGGPCQTLGAISNLSFPKVSGYGAASVYIRAGNVERTLVVTSLTRNGWSQANPVLPTPLSPVPPDQCPSIVGIPAIFCFHFPGVPGQQWFDPPLAFGYEYVTTSDSLFTKILEFPTGFQNAFTVSTNGVPLGQYGPGQSVDFRGFSGGGVSSFRVTGIAPLVDAANPAAFPIKLEFNTQTASFAMLPLSATPMVSVTVDIKPGTFPNTINLGSRGTVPVAIISTVAFDARTVDPLTVTVAGASVKVKANGTMSSFEDVNRDGLLDLLVHVSTEAFQLTNGDTEAVVEGKTFGFLSEKCNCG